MTKRAIAYLVSFLASAALMGCGSSSGSGNGITGYTGTGVTPTPTAAAAADVVITINGIDGNMSFSPASATAKVGQTVAWKNNDGITHRVVDDGNAFDTGDIGENTQSGLVTLKTAGTFPYHCSIHPSMTGTLVVTN